MSWRSRIFGGGTATEPPRGPGRAGAGALAGRVAVVTGGAGPLGSAVCEAMAAEGAGVVVAHLRREAEATRLAARIRESGGRAVAVRADLRARAEVEALAAAARDALGPVDILVNNASTLPGEVPMKGFLDHTWDEYQQYIDTVLKGAVHCCQAVLPGMVERRWGRIISVGSTALNELNAHLNPYVTAKGGLLGMTRSLAEEFGPHGITVNQVVPSRVRTPETRAREVEGDRPFVARSPLAPGVVTPAQVADVVVFLASERAAMITGAYVPVCAGQVVTA
jgi:NAD(P)-dependent dehydrogenase (short-subunit alcohol dehydrogenase family)